jgi:hypothetical protein
MPLAYAQFLESRVVPFHGFSTFLTPGRDLTLTQWVKLGSKK